MEKHPSSLSRIAAIVLMSCVTTICFGQSDASQHVPGATTVKFDVTTLDMPDFPFDNPCVVQVINVSKLKDKNGATIGGSVAYATVMIAEGTQLTLADSTLITSKYTSSIVKWNVFQGDFIYVIVDYSQVPKKNRTDGFYSNSQFFKPNRTYVMRVVFFDKQGKYLTHLSRSNHIRTKFGDYMKSDFGFGYVNMFNPGVIGFASAHVYLYPINYDADLGKIKSLYKQASMRLSGFFGISPITIYSNTQQPIVPLTKTGNFVYGLGIRSPLYGYYGQHRVLRAILQPMRLTIGNVVFTQNNASPLISTPEYKQALYFGISYDLTLSTLFSPITKLTTPP